MISIILPTYKGEKYISKSIDSVISQDYLDWELIVIIDGSMDKTIEIVKNYQRTNSKIILIENDKNLGLAKTLNKGLLLARGEYVARIDDDDIWISTDKLSKQVEFLEKNKDYILIGTQFKIVDETQKLLYQPRLPSADQEIRKCILRYNPFCHSSVLFRREIALNTGGYNNNLRYTEDWDLWLKLGAEGKMTNTNETMVEYLSRSGMSTQTRKMSQIKYVYRILKTYGKLYPRRLFSWLFLLKYTIIG